MSLGELAALTASAIEARDVEKDKHPKIKKPAVFTGKFESARLRIRMESGGTKEKEEESSKGKERVIEEEISIPNASFDMEELPELGDSAPLAPEPVYRSRPGAFSGLLQRFYDKGYFYRPIEEDCTITFDPTMLQNTRTYIDIPETQGLMIDDWMLWRMFPACVIDEVLYGEKNYLFPPMSYNYLKRWVLPRLTAQMTREEGMKIVKDRWIMYLVDKKEVGPAQANFWGSVLLRNTEKLRGMEEGFWQRLWQRACRRGSLFGGLMNGVYLGALAWITIRVFLRAVMPAAAYAPRSEAKYDSNPVAKKKADQTVTRAARSANARINTIRETKVIGESGSNFLSQHIVNNYEWLEVRVVPKDTPLLKVCEFAPVASSYILFISGRKALVPGHTVYAFGETTPEYTRYVTLTKVGNYTRAYSEIIDYGEIRGDIRVMEFPGLCEKKKIVSYFADALPNWGSIEALRPIPDSQGFRVERVLNYESQIAESGTTDYAFQTDLVFHGIRGGLGLCGTAYSLRETGKVIAIHMGGEVLGQRSYGVMIVRSDLEVFTEGEPETHDPISISVQEDVQMQCVAGLANFGCVPKKMAVFMPDKTSLVESIFYYWSSPLPPNEDGPAHLKPVVIDGEKISPRDVALSKFGRQFDIGTNHAPFSYMDVLPKSFDLSKMKVLTKEEAIYGIPLYMDAIDFTTSAGYRWKKLGLTRKALCFDADGNRRLHPLLVEDIAYYLKIFENGDIMPVIFEMTLKDEIRSHEKNSKCETRLFDSGDFTSFIIQRMYLGAFFTEATKDPVRSPIGICINAHSKDWGYLYAYLKGSEERFVLAGDFSNYDLSIKNIWRDRFIDFLILLYRSVVHRNVILANFLAWHIISFWIYGRPYGTSSGGYLTSIFNTITNWGLHKEAFINLYSEEEWKDIRCTFCGDDSVLTVPVRYNLYNMTYLKEYFYENYGMIYTSPTKTDEMSVSWESLTFLKRQFVRGHAGVMAPLSKRSMFNMIKWTDAPGNLEVMGSVCNSLLLEAWHYGAEMYQSCFDWIMDEGRRLGHLFVVPTWEEMRFKRMKDY
jgi:hypothetical protein